MKNISCRINNIETTVKINPFPIEYTPIESINMKGLSLISLKSHFETDPFEEGKFLAVS